MRGLNDELSIQLVATRFDNYQELLDRAVIVESKYRGMENHKRKHSHMDSYPGLYQKPNTSYEGNGHDHHGHKNHTINYGSGNGNKSAHINGGNNDMNGRTSNSNKRDISQVLCYNCKELGHYSWDCPGRKKDVGCHNLSDKSDKSQLECFKCHELGHYSWDCPEGKNGTGGSKESKSISSKKVHVNHVNAEKDVEEVFEAHNTTTRKF